MENMSAIESGGRLHGKTAVITGAGSGIGRASVHRFTREGATVVALDIDGGAAAAALEEAAAIGFAREVDVCDEGALREAVHEAVTRFGAIDCYFNNAGVSHAPAFVEDIAADAWDRVIDTNLRAFYIAARIVVPIMKGQRSGVILVTGSMGALRPRPRLAAYTAAKAGAVALARQLAIETAEFGIRVNAICPVATDTPMLAMLDADTRAAIGAQIPIGRLAKPDDIAAAAVFLMSEEAAMITGVALEVDGGRGI